MAPLARSVSLIMLLGALGCGTPPAPTPAERVPRAGSPELPTQPDPAITELVRRCKAGETCPPPGSAARRACDAVAAIDVRGGELVAFRSDDPQRIESATAYYRERLEQQERAARDGGVAQTTVFADDTATALADIEAARSPEAVRSAIMQHMTALGRFQRWCTVGDAALPSSPPSSPP
ncbi:MAG: hypothetical protein KDK70_05605 [Myxococcales bacterium]|nr:hypothetical protein [Myxococcales bacterium]